MTDKRASPVRTSRSSPRPPAGGTAADAIDAAVRGAEAAHPVDVAIPRRTRRDADLDGILVVDKPVGPTSHDVVALVRRLAGTRRIGHGGTLDPFASGVLPLYLGVATRLAEFHLGATKAYRATVCFGASSTTDDLEGELTPAATAPPTRDRVEDALATFVGTHLQTPPGFSAQRIGGRRAYALARKGEVPVLPARTVTFHALSLASWNDTDPVRPTAEVEVACSAGTYVRALARDLGTAVGSGAYLGALRRTVAGPFTLASARPLEAIREAAAAGRLPTLLLPVGAGLDDVPAVTLDPDELVVVAHGGWIRAGARLDGIATAIAGGAPGELVVRLLGPGDRLVAIGRVASGRIVPDKVLVPRATAGDGRAGMP